MKTALFLQIESHNMRNWTKICLLSTICVFSTQDLAHAQNSSFINETPESIKNFSVSSDLLSTISDALPEERGQIDQNFLNQSYDPNISLSSNSQLAITFIDEGAGYRNSLGYFTYTNDTFSGLSFADIDTDNSGIISTSEISSIGGVSTNMVFPNASKVGSGGLLQTGDTYVVGGGSIDFTDDSWVISDGTIFDAGTNVGFFLAANAWNDYGSVGTVDGWNGISGDPYTYYSLDFLNPENNINATIDTVDYNARHVALTFESSDRNTLIMGFEDLNRKYGSDDDFNDAVFLVRSDPTGAMANTNVEVYSAPAPIAGGGIASFFILVFSLFGKNSGLTFAMSKHIRKKQVA